MAEFTYEITKNIINNSYIGSAQSSMFHIKSMNNDDITFKDNKIMGHFNQKRVASIISRNSVSIINNDFSIFS